MGDQGSKDNSDSTKEGIGKFDPERYKIPEGTPKTGIVIGAGCRGHSYSYYAKYHPNEFKIIGVCDPREYHRNYEKELHDIPSEHVFSDWRDAAEIEKFADSVLICTPDRLHKDPVVAFAKKGYHVLLEKPMAVTEEECEEIVRTCQENNVILSVCHVLRYTPWVQKVKEIIDSGQLGDIVNINHTEPVGFWHFAHSFVRGNWCNEAESSFSLLAKCCHDIDLICYWMAGRKCEKVSSFGNLSHFTQDQKPEGAASRCMDCPANIENNCPYSAKKIYLEPVQKGRAGGWPYSVVSDIVDIENISKALQDGPYGRCVYESDNDVMSHQVVNMQFEGGPTATLQMVAFTEKLCVRQVRFYGTKGEMTVVAGYQPKIKVFDFLTQTTNKYFPEDTAPPGPLCGHGGADYHTIKAFVDTLHNPSEVKIQTGPEETLLSHLLVFAAERARIENRVVNLKDNGNYD